MTPDQAWMTYVEARVRAAAQPQRNFAAGRPLGADRDWPDVPASSNEDEAEEFFKAAAHAVQVRRLERAGAPEAVVAQMRNQWRAAHDARWVDILDRQAARMDVVAAILDEVQVGEAVKAPPRSKKASAKKQAAKKVSKKKVSKKKVSKKKVSRKK